MAEGSREQAIGRNVAFFRGERSQQSVADSMRERGHKWSQATVWAVEKGDRPLRLAEADDLAKLLGCHIWELAAGSDELQAVLRMSRRILDIDAAYGSAVAAMSLLMKRRADADWDATNAAHLLEKASGGGDDLRKLSAALEGLLVILDGVTPESVLLAAQHEYLHDFGSSGTDEEASDGQHQEEA